jgi:hypothetical protein
LERKIAIATRGLDNHFIIHLRRLQRRQNIETICNYIIAMNTEINPVLAHKKDQLQVLCYYLSEYYCNQNQNQNNKNNQNKNKSFYEMTRDDILGYLANVARQKNQIHIINGLTRITCVDYILWVSLNGCTIKTSLT